MVNMKNVTNLTDRWLACRQFLGSFMIDKQILKQGKPFYNNKNGKNMDRTLLEDYGRNFDAWEWKEIGIKIKGAAGQLISNELRIEYPHIDFQKGEQIDLFFRDSVLIRWAVKNKLIDDETLSMLRGILMPFHIMYDKANKRVGLYPKEKSLALSDSYDVRQVLDKEIELWYVNKEIWDRTMQFGYTHILRRNLELSLQSWQRRLLFNWKQFNYVAGSRRIGKTYTSAYIAKRELYRKGWGYWKRERQIIFVTVSEEKMWQPLQYLMSMCKEDMKLGFIKYTQRDKQFENTLTWAKLIFRSAWSRTWAASYGADLVILDEAAMISDGFWEDLLPIVIQEGATVFAISTINEDVKDNWFYAWLVEAEMGMNEDSYAIRVTIDDNELLTDERKEVMKAALIHKPMRYWTQLYSIFPSGNTVFSLTWVIQPPLQEKPHSVVIGYDPWKIQDNAAVIIIDPNQMRVIEEITWYQLSYRDQKAAMKDIKKKYPKSVVCMDRTWVGEWVSEIFWELIDVGVKYKGSGETNYNQVFAYYQVSKMNLVEMTRLYFDNYWLKINSDLINLISEIKWFQKIKQGRVTIQYAGVWVKDDSVNALMVACFHMKHILWITQKGQLLEDRTSFLNKSGDAFLDWLFEYDEYNESTFRKFNY